MARKENEMVKIEFEYADSMSNWQWRRQSCVVRSLEECKKIYGLIISVEEVKE